MKIKVAITQMHCDDNYENNINRAEQLVRKAASEGANIILLQELLHLNLNNYQFFLKEFPQDNIELKVLEMILSPKLWIKV